MKNPLDDIERELEKAVSFFWATRLQQATKQKAAGNPDYGDRSAVTGGAQMDGFIQLLVELTAAAGIDKSHIFQKSRLQLPGFFRPTKDWDVLVVKDQQLILAIEVKSHIGPSFGNNFNNRTEEAMGSALDLWTAFRKGALNSTNQPWLGYCILLEDCEKSRTPVKVKEPHFKVLPEFSDASYAKRYELFCRKLVRERHYNATAFLTSQKQHGANGHYNEPAPDLAFRVFAKSLIAHAAAYADS